MGIPAGAYWCEQFPTDRTTAGLIQPFRRSVQQFITTLEAGGAQVKIAATRRPAERAYLMRGCWDIVKDGADPAEIPAHPNVNIVWTREGAQEMFGVYRLVYRPSLTSRHIDGRAIDMSIMWTGVINVVDGRGVRVALDWTRLADRTTRLYAIGASFGVKKLLSDAPHWSDDGR